MDLGLTDQEARLQAELLAKVARWVSRDLSRDPLEKKVERARATAGRIQEKGRRE